MECDKISLCHKREESKILLPAGRTVGVQWVDRWAVENEFDTVI